jgi:hypothetical protein
MRGLGIIADTTTIRVKHRNGGRGADFRDRDGHAVYPF